MKLSGLGRDSARKVAHRLMEQKFLLRIGPELYANGLHVPAVEAAACVLRTAYVSFEHALFLHGIVDQAPYVVTCATLGRPGRVSTALGEIHYHHIVRRLFRDFTSSTGGLLATPEKAVLDLLYLRLRQAVPLDTSEWNLSVLSAPKMAELLRLYPQTVGSKAGQLDLPGAGD